jgi:branched-chain amino acid transport system substrate-binding protein
VQRAQIRFFRLRGWKRIALITSTDASGQDGERGIDETMALPENSEMKMLEVAHFNITDVSVSAQVAQIKAAGPQAVIIWTTGPSLGTVLNGFKQAGYDLPVAISYGNMTYAQFNGPLATVLPTELYIACPPWVGGNPKGLNLPAGVQAAQRDFFATFHAHGINPDVGSSSSWDPMMILVGALRKLGPAATATQIRDYIVHLRGFPGVYGMYDFEKYPQRGLGEESAVVTRWIPARKTWEIVSRPTGIPL